MFNLLDLMRAAQGGAAMNNMARQFGLSAEQIQRAMEALMPAFTLGFRRNAADPMGFAQLLGMMGSGQFARFYDQPNLAFTPKAWGEGNQVLGHLFGNDVSRQVAEQTAAWAGIAPDVMQQMMPRVAAMLMGGLSRSAASQGLAEMLEQFARILRDSSPDSRSDLRRRSGGQAAMPNPFEAWSDMLRTLWGIDPSGQKSEPQQNPAHHALNPFALWAEMMTPLLGGPQATLAAPEPPPPANRPAPQNPVDFFGQMFETGRDVQQQHLATLQNIFDTYWGGESKRR